MPIKLTQALVNRARDEHAPSTQLYDAEVSGLRLVVGKRSCSYKLVGRINDNTGRYVSCIIGRSDEIGLKAARDEATTLRSTLRRGIDPRSPKRSVPSLCEAWDRYREARIGDLRPRTIAWYQDQVDGPLASLRNFGMDHIDRETVRTLHERITRENGPYRANGAMRALKAIYNDVCRTHDLPPNPVVRAVRFNKEKARDWALSPNELPDLWQAIGAMEDRTRAACWTTMLLLGLRCGDARSMQWEHLDDEGVLLVPSPKGGPDRSFQTPLPKPLLNCLEDVRHATSKLESPFVFPSPSSASGHLEQLKRTPTFDYAPHQMRHTYRTMSLEAGIDMQTVVMLMNHRPAGVTWGYVTRAHLMGHLGEAQDKICAKIMGYR